MAVAFSLPMFGRLAKKYIWASDSVSVLLTGWTVGILFSTICSWRAATWRKSIVSLYELVFTIAMPFFARLNIAPQTDTGWILLNL